MKKYSIHVHSKKLLADTLTPVNIYLKLRDVFAGSILLESSDYHGHENSLSFICCNPIASFQVMNQVIEVEYPDGSNARSIVTDSSNLINSLEEFKNSFEVVDSAAQGSESFGLFGYTAYDAVSSFEEVTIDRRSDLIPDILYKFYQHVIQIDHFSNQLTLLHYSLKESGIEEELNSIEQLIFSNRFSTYSFRSTEAETSNISDDQYLELVRKGIKHCNLGDVFQIVLSRRFSRPFKGDEFNVYRALRSINPSPYLFYFDYGYFKLFGSSPEAQLQIKNRKASIFPIAGTFKRTGNDVEDTALAKALAADEKENAEHLMLVDLARNDISRNAANVNVEVFKEIQYYSHVIHLVSKVTGELKNGTSLFKVVADTFPAGTLSGAPKHKAITLINQYENINRSFYGGSIGFLGFHGAYNHAIMIRTFLSKDNTLTYQAGAGIVAKSNPETELQEVNNKLAALRRAVVMAQTI
jgi:anthranilate synthase component 1